jgi:hypothetical protein
MATTLGKSMGKSRPAVKDFKQGGKAWNEMLACLTAIDGDEQMTVELKQQVVWCSGFGQGRGG